MRLVENFGDPIFIANLRETINGFYYGNTPPMVMKKGERVRWYLFGSTNFEIHAPHWHGNTVVARHMRTDVTSLLPMDMVVADMEPDNLARGCSTVTPARISARAWSRATRSKPPRIRRRPSRECSVCESETGG